MADPRHVLGRRAELAVGDWLVAAGWRLLATRWRSGSGEIDLICRDPRRALVAVEVKLRRTGRAGTGSQGLTPRQLHRLRSTLALYAEQRRIPAGERRVDLVEVTPADEGRWRVRRTPGVDGW